MWCILLLLCLASLASSLTNEEKHILVAPDGHELHLTNTQMSILSQLKEQISLYRYNAGACTINPCPGNPYICLGGDCPPCQKCSSFVSIIRPLLLYYPIYEIEHIVSYYCQHYHEESTCFVMTEIGGFLMLKKLLQEKHLGVPCEICVYHGYCVAATSCSCGGLLTRCCNKFNETCVCAPRQEQLVREQWGFASSVDSEFLSTYFGGDVPQCQAEIPTTASPATTSPDTTSTN